MKIYTRTGDDGTTGLLGPDRVSKSDPRMDCTGTLDELNASLGLACAVATSTKLPDQLRLIQNELFVVGARLACVDPSASKYFPMLDKAVIARLESEIDAADAMLAPLKNFILPGGTEVAARLHLSRTICRRAERVLVAFSKHHPLDGHALAYLNRLSDWLFTMARLANHEARVADIPWQK